MQANQPNVQFYLERAAGRKAYWYTDGYNQFKGWTLKEKSKDLAAVWTPLGLLRPTRWQFGLMNAGIVTQGDLRVMMERDLSKHTKDHVNNVADDFLGFADHEVVDGECIIDWDGLADSFIEFIKMCDDNNMSIKGSETCFGFPSAEFFGYILDEDGRRGADHNLMPIERMTRPNDK
jgi:hypothetical protein